MHGSSLMQMSYMSSIQASSEPRKMDLLAKDSTIITSKETYDPEKTEETTKGIENSTQNSSYRLEYMNPICKTSGINSSSHKPCKSIKMDLTMKSTGANSSTYPCPLPSPMMTNSGHLTATSTSVGVPLNAKPDDAKSSYLVTNGGRGSGNSTRSDNLESSSAPIKPHTGGDVRWDAINLISSKDSSLGHSHFRLLKRLGYGDIGSVYLVELRGTNAYFAMKVMDKGSLASRNKLLRAQTEREILGLLDHPFLPTLYSYFETDKFYCLVMEFCGGGNLHSLRQKQPNKHFTEEAARSVHIYVECFL